MSRAVTYVLKFYRNRKLLDAEIHRTMEDVCSAAMGYVATFSTNLQLNSAEMLLSSWEPSENRFDWDDGEYSLIIEEYLAKRSPSEDNDCQVINLEKRRSHGQLQENSG